MILIVRRGPVQDLVMRDVRATVRPLPDTPTRIVVVEGADEPGLAGDLDWSLLGNIIFATF